MSDFVCTVPLPERDLSPNTSKKGSHWTATKARAAYRKDCGLRFSSGAPREPFVDCDVLLEMLVCRKPVMAQGMPRPGVPLAAMDSYRPLDTDNATASLKGLMDGLQDARVIHTDRATHCHLTVDIVPVPTHLEEGVRVTVSGRESSLAA